MPLDKGLLDVLARKQFWLDYFLMNEEGGEDPVFPGVRVDLPLPGDYTLRLRIYERDWEKTLNLVGPALEGDVLLAQNTATFFEPWYALRWKECAAICRCLEVREGIRHPGWPVLLLSPFTTVLLERDRSQALDALRDAWRWTGLLTAEEVEAF